MKERLSVTHDKFDTQLANKLTQAYNWVNRQLSPYVSTPLGSPPQEIIDIEADYAAGLYREEASGKFVGERNIPHVLRKRAMDDLMDYIRVNYLGTTSRRGYLRHVKSHHSWDTDHGAYSD